jgi:hypothetical protein
MAEVVPSPRSEDWLPKRDYILLPLIVLATIVLLLGCGEILARVFWAEHLDNACAYQTPLGKRFRANCSSPEKAVEGPWTTSVDNECGYRTTESCVVRGPDQLRVVVLGSSAARGALVAYEHTFAARASAALTGACRRIVDFQNLGTEAADLDRNDLRISEALALKPTAIVIVIGPYDIEHLKETTQGAATAGFQFNLHDLDAQLRKSRLFLVGQHYLYRDPAVQIAAFLRNGDESSRYLQNPLPETWRKQVDDVGALLGRITAQTAPANVPVLLFYLPTRTQAALAISKYARPGIDTAALGEALRATATQNGVAFVDTTPDFAGARDFGSLFYQADGHPTAEGHAVIAERVESTLLKLPAFGQCRAFVGARQ